MSLDFICAAALQKLLKYIFVVVERKGMLKRVALFPAERTATLRDVRLQTEGGPAGARQTEPAEKQAAGSEHSGSSSGQQHSVNFCIFIQVQHVRNIFLYKL